MSLDPATEVILHDIADFIDLLGRKLKGTTSAADNDDCNSRLREAFPKMDQYCREGEVFDVNNAYWQRLKEMLWSWKAGEDVDSEQKLELTEWVIEMQEDGIIPRELSPAAVLAEWADLRRQQR